MRLDATCHTFWGNLFAESGSGKATASARSQSSSAYSEETSMQMQAARVSWCAADNASRQPRSPTQPSGKMTIQMTLVSGEA
jgi:hypothetical protein